MGKKGQRVWTGGGDEAALSKGVFNTYIEDNLRYSQNAPLDMYGQMVAWLKENRTRWVIDASHPYAEMVSHNLLRACETAGVLL
ncbi:precorrin-6A/cobalt-precorrin-6A reductase, partial [Salmonella enterica subsp. enterica serovar Anatum]|nr:precorrin-6A/cobalt-precorrin-6A reductase [Salmonella enterica subsp. enterica serovar Anatum]